MITLRTQVVKTLKILAMAAVCCLEAALFTYIMMAMQAPTEVQGSLALINSMIAAAQMIAGIWLLRKCKCNDLAASDAGTRSV